MLQEKFRNVLKRIEKTLLIRSQGYTEPVAFRKDGSVKKERYDAADAA